MNPGKYALVFFTLIFCPLETSCTKGYCFTTYRNGKLVPEGDCMSESEQNAIIKDFRAKLEKRQMERTTSIAPTMNDELTTAAHPTIDEVSTTAIHPTINEESTTVTYPTMNEESTTATTVTKETNMETSSITAVINYESTTTAHPTTNKESTMADHPTTNEESTTATHPTMNEKSITATHPATNEESTTAAHPTTNEELTTATHPTMNESATINEESTTVSNPRKTGGNSSSCKDACMSSWMTNDPVVSKRLGGWSIKEGGCQCRTFIQSRYNNQISFARNLTEYQRGFGELIMDSGGEYWLGLDKIQASTNRTGGVDMRIRASNNQTRKIFSAKGVHVAARSENYRLTMLHTNDEAVRQLNGSIFEVKNIEADGCKGVSGWWFGDISGDRTNGKWCNPNGPYQGGAGIKWRNETGTSSGVGDDTYHTIWIEFKWIIPNNA